MDEKLSVVTNTKGYGTLTSSRDADYANASATKAIEKLNCQECVHDCTLCDQEEAAASADVAGKRRDDDATTAQQTVMTSAYLGTVFLLLALCLHTVFEGLAFGLLTNQTDVWSLFIAVAIHKVIIAFSLGLRVTENVRPTTKAVMFILVFAVSCVIGGVLGITITEAKTDDLTSLVMSSVLQGIATGTFVHVVFFEILYTEIAHTRSLSKVLATFGGFVIMAVVSWFLPA